MKGFIDSEMTEKEIILKQIDILQARQETEGLNVVECPSKNGVSFN